MSEQQPSGKDEKGLTLSGRTMLRIMVEFNKVLSASREIGDKHGFELIQTPTVLVEIRSLLWIAHEMAKRLGGPSVVDPYLQAHAEEDKRAVRDGMKETGKELIDEMLAMAGIPKCPKCDHLICPICRECHTCEKDETHGHEHSVFGVTGSKATN